MNTIQNILLSIVYHLVQRNASNPLYQIEYLISFSQLYTPQISFLVKKHFVTRKYCYMVYQVIRQAAAWPQFIWETPKICSKIIQFTFILCKRSDHHQNHPFCNDSTVYNLYLSLSKSCIRNKMDG